MDEQTVIDLGQGHLLESIQGDEGKTQALLDQLEKLNKQYPGGLEKYISNAKKLLKDSKDGVNPFEGFTASVPNGERLSATSPLFEECENIGIENIGTCGFVLVAGGLGERLGYHGIKVALPTEILTGRCFLEHYCSSILALQDRACKILGKEVQIPLAIMTSGDTHEKTVELLHKHTNFGMAEGQITLMQQEKVPALLDNEARFAQDGDNMVLTKPAGHGDVHKLLHSTGTAEKWASKGTKWLVFIQDTNALVFRAVVAAVGVSVKHDFDMNSLTVPRKPGEAVGGIAQLNKEDGSTLVCNCEYNQLDALLKSEGGDVADDSGFSPYPGNINVLLLKMQSYGTVLEETHGSIPEFVNPKYADAEKTVFKKPTRLESMMQDYPKLLDSSAKVGFTQMERFMCFSAVKNNPTDALGKLKSTGFAESASSGESDVYGTNRLLLSIAGVAVNTADFKSTQYLGIPFPLGAKVVLSPSFGCTISEIRSRFPSPEKVTISDSSSLHLEGDVTIESLELDGDLRVIASPGAKIVIKNLSVKNKGVEFIGVDFEDSSVEEKFRIRGYVKKEHESLVLARSEPGEEVIDRP